MKYARMLVSLAALCHTAADAEITPWQIGGSGLDWAESDSVSILVDKASGAIQPVYIRPDRSVFSYLENWGSWNPRELGYVDGERPRVAEGTRLVAGDSTSYTAPSSGGVPQPRSHEGSSRRRSANLPPLRRSRVAAPAASEAGSVASSVAL